MMSFHSISDRIEQWKQTPSINVPITHKSLLVLIDTDGKHHRIMFTIDAKIIKVQLPNDCDSLYVPETEDVHLLSCDWLNHLSGWCFDKSTTNITLEEFLDKCISVYIKSNPDAVKNIKSPSSIKQKHTPKAHSNGINDDHDGDNDINDIAWHDDDTQEISMSISKKDNENEHNDVDDDDDWNDDNDMDMNNDEEEEEGDWGDFVEENAEQCGIEDVEYTQFHDLKKRWTAKECELRKTAAKVDKDKAAVQIFSSKAASKIVTNALIDFMKNGKQHGVEVNCVDDNVFTWQVRMHDFDQGSTMYKDLMKLKSKYNYNFIELEFKFLMDLFPFFPPSVRLVRPRLKNFMIGRIVCMEELSLSKWNSTRTMTEILAAIRRLLTTYGEVDDTIPGVNDLNATIPPYTAVEFQLLRLSMLTEIAPRVVKLLADQQQMQFIVPKLKTKLQIEKEKEKEIEKAKEKAKEKQKQLEQEASGISGPAAPVPTVPSTTAALPSSKFWASGTGYGHGSTHGSTGWDPEAFVAAQRKKDVEIQEIADEIVTELGTNIVPDSLVAVLEQSCLVPFLATYLATDSLTDMEHHADLYHTLLNICSSMAKHNNVVRLFHLLPGEKRSLFSYLTDLHAQASIVAKFDKEHANTNIANSPASSVASSISSALSPSLASSSSSSSPHSQTAPTSISLTAHIMKVYTDVENGLKHLQLLEDSTNKHATCDTEKKNDSDTPDYVTLLAPEKFSEVSSFVHHHYWSQYQSTGVTNRQFIRRLATEYSDLSKSLPLTSESSVFLRVHESKMAFCQFLIIAPTDTPYARGCFLFDAYFPETYPNAPPHVNLQTTGNGSVRFNPNLYNCGKVCLSLLGTWSGSQGESWNAKTSTFLQVMVSIQSLIFVPQPYFNEPGYERDMHTERGRTASKEYNNVIEIATVKHAMLDMMNKPPSHFENIIRTHFTLQRGNILETVTSWGETNPGVKILIPQLVTALDKQSLPNQTVAATQ